MTTRRRTTTNDENKGGHSSPFGAGGKRAFCVQPTLPRLAVSVRAIKKQLFAHQAQARNQDQEHGDEGEGSGDADDGVGAMFGWGDED